LVVIAIRDRRKKTKTSIVIDFGYFILDFNRSRGIARYEGYNANPRKSIEKIVHSENKAKI